MILIYWILSISTLFTSELIVSSAKNDVKGINTSSSVSIKPTEKQVVVIINEKSTTDANSVKIKNSNRLLAFCKTCSHLKWRKIESYLRKIRQEEGTNRQLETKTMKTRAILAEKLYSINDNPALIYLSAKNFTSKYESKWPWNFNEIRKWMKKTNKRIELWQTYAMNESYLQDILDQNTRNDYIWIILLYKDEFVNQANKNATIEINTLLDELRNKFRTINKKVRVGKIDIISDDIDLLMYDRLDLDLGEISCPMIIIIYKNAYQKLPIECKEVHYSNAIIDESTRIITSWTLSLENAEQIHPKSTDLMLTFKRLERRSENEKNNTTFWAIGVTGGIAVVALAISIFWGLKSSS